MHIMAVKDVDGQFEWIALGSGLYGQLADPLVEQLLHFLLR